MRSPSATLATLKNSIKNLSPSSEKLFPACSIPISSPINPSTLMPEIELNVSSRRLSALVAIPTLWAFLW